MGINAVAGMGIASLIHQTAINTAMAATFMAGSLMPSGSGQIINNKNKAGPSIKPSVE
jgi:hypothetical protein